VKLNQKFSEGGDVMREWALKGLVEHFGRVHHTMLDHKFVWMLGAGASLASGIPLGRELVESWLRELHVREDGGKSRLEDWATAKNLGIEGFEYERRGSFYTKIYELRFGEHPEEGYAYLETIMANTDPSPGYSILAAALAGSPPDRPPRHNAVVTTNFDNLVADALSIYTDTYPFVCGHESLTPFIKVAMRRPVVCKIHRDLLLAPQNDPRSLRRLHDAWGMALRALFEHYTPLFIGYGGNDDTLMDLLASLGPNDVKGQLIWCYHEGSKPSNRILEVVTDLHGVLVPVPDFDMLMVLLGEKMGIELLDEEIEERAKKRTARYRSRIRKLDTVKHPYVMQALAATFERSGGWFAWYQKAKVEDDPIRREIIYRQGIQQFPNSPELYANFANFMYDIRDDPEEAARLFDRALKLEPNRVNTISNYAEFLLVEGRIDEASEQLNAASELLEDAPGQTIAHLALNSTIVASVQKKDSTTAFKWLRESITGEFPRESGSFESLLVFARKKVSQREYRVFCAAVEALLDSERVPNALNVLDDHILSCDKAKLRAKRKTGKGKTTKRRPKRGRGS